MATDLAESLRQGILGTVLQMGEAKTRLEGAMLKFDADHGATVEFSSRQALPKGSIPIEGFFHGIGWVRLHKAQWEHRSANSGDHRVRYRALYLFSSKEPIDVSGMRCSGFRFDFSDLLAYANERTVRIEHPTEGCFKALCEDRHLLKQAIPAWGGGWEAELRFGYSWKDRNFQVEPDVIARVDHDELLGSHEEFKRCTAFQALFDFLTHSSHDNHAIRLVDREDRFVVVRSARGKGTPLDRHRPTLQVPLELVLSALPTGIPKWDRTFYTSKALDNVLRLIRHKELPRDLRFLMSFSACEAAHRELFEKRSSKSRPKTIHRLEAFDRYWSCFKLKNTKAYLSKLVQYRDTIAHSLEEKGGRAVHWRDLSRGQQYLLLVAKAAVLEWLGADVDAVGQFVFERASELQQHFGKPGERLADDEDLDW